MISISELFDMDDWDEVEPAVWDELNTELKRRIDAASQKYADNYLDAMLQAGCSHEVIKQCYKIGIIYTENFVIEEMLDEDYYKLYFEKLEEWNLAQYVYSSIKNSGEKAILNLPDKEVEIAKNKAESKPINYEALKEVLHYQCENVFDGGNQPKTDDLPIICDLDRRTMRIFKYVHDEICLDDDLNSYFSAGDVDSIVDRIVLLISKHDGTNIPEPYKDIDDWWGDFNNTINYIVDDYKKYDMRT